MTADNIRHEVYRGHLILYIDLNPKEPRLSSSGKHLLIATTHGTRPLKGNGFLLGLNLLSKDIPANLKAEAAAKRLASIRLDLDEFPDLFKLIRANGGLKASHLTGEYRALPLYLKNRNGKTLGRMAECLFQTDPEVFRDGEGRRANGEKVDELDLLDAIADYQLHKRAREEAMPENLAEAPF